MQTIDSKDNPRYKDWLRVRKGKDRSRIFVEGARLSLEALASHAAINAAVFSRSFTTSSPKETELLRTRAASVFVLKDRLFDSLAATRTPQGVAMICDRPRYTFEDLAEALSQRSVLMPSLVLLSKVNNPGNLGSVLRTIEAAGAVGAMTSEDSSDAFSPAALRGSMGAAFRLPIAEKVDAKQVIELARNIGLRVVVTEALGGHSIWEADLARPSLFVFGSEAHGLSGEILKEADTSVRIPLENQVESLNLAVSAGIVLFEAKRQMNAIR